MSKYTSTHCSVHVHSILARLSFSALLCYSSTVKLTNQHVLFATFNRITGSHVWQMSLWYPHQHSFTLWLNYEQKKKRRESPCERVKEWGREKWRNEGSEGCRGGWNVEIWITNPSCTIWTEKTHIIVESRHIELDLLRDPSAPREINLIPWFD